MFIGNVRENKQLATARRKKGKEAEMARKRER